MFRILILLSVLMLAAMACSLTNGDATVTKMPTRTPFASAPVITNPPATNTPTPQPTATVRPASSGDPAPAANCTPRTDWPVYNVQSGDTLGTIAQRSGTTATQLTAANCLSNPNLLSVGQQIRVPRQPDPVVVPTTSTNPGPVIIGSSAGSGMQTDGFNYWVPANTNVYLSWPDAARLNAGPVEFFYTPDGGSPQSLGMDYDISTDAGIYWIVALNIRGAVYAVGRGNPVESAHIRVEGVPSQSPEPGPVVIGASAGSGIQTDGYNYWVPANTEVYISWPDAARLNAGPVEFVFVPDGGSPQSLGRDNDISTDAGIYWTVTLNMRGTIYAMGTGINPVQSALIQIEGVPAN